MSIDEHPATANAANAPAPIVAEPDAPGLPIAGGSSTGRSITGRSITRRRLLVGAGVLAVGGIAAWTLRHGDDDARIATIDGRPALPVLPLDEGRVELGIRRFDLRLRSGRTLLPGAAGSPHAGTWGINRSYLGPVVRAARGEIVAMNVRNDLAEATTLHWHGMHLPADVDGGPMNPIEAGELWSPSWTIDQPAATLWFHPHLFGHTRDHVMRGLLGFFLVDDDASTGLPSTYGVDDVAVVLQQTTIGRDGTLDAVDGATVVLSNGAVGPAFVATTGRVRLRLLNASDVRSFVLQRDDGQHLTVVGSDGGLLAAPASVAAVEIGPGERVEIVEAVDHVVRLVAPSADGSSTDVVLTLQPPRTPTSTTAPSFTVPVELPTVDAGTHVRPLTLDAGTSGFGIDGQSMTAHETMQTDAAGAMVVRPDGSMAMGMAMDGLTFDVDLDSTEIWTITNQTDSVHFFHVHDVQFAVLDRDGAPPLQVERGRKDTVQVAPGSVVRIAMRFTDYASRTAAYMFHCHMMTHEDDGMMGQFYVV